MATCPTCGFGADDEARFCSRCGLPLVAGPSAGRRALATVLFCDLVGSTRLGETVDAEVVRELLSSYYATCSEVLRRHGGLVDKFIGDAVMCVFGLPAPREDDALRACRAACELVDAVGELSERLRAEFGVGLEVHVGVHTGEAMSGDPRRGETLLVGDVVNTAARLEQAAEAGEILIGEPTHRLVVDEVRVEAREPLSAKGKAEPVPVWRLLSASSVGAARAPGSDTEFVARSAEVAELRRTFEAVAEARRSESLLLVGEAGIGKSRLLAEFVATLPGAARVLRGRCLAYGEGVTYWPLREVLDELAGDNPALLLRVLEEEPDPEQTIERLLLAAGRREGELRAEEAVAAVAALLAGLARTRTVVVVVEDLHWAESPMLELLDALHDRLSAAPLLVLATTRSSLPEDVLSRSRTMRIGALDADAASALLAARGVASEKERRKMARAAGGNPLYLEQLHAAAGTSTRPGSGLALSALLSARLGELEAGPREVLEAASIVGQEFWMAALFALVPDVGTGEMLSRLAVLERHEFISQGRALDRSSIARSLSGVFGSEGRFSFRHGLIRDAAREAMGKRRAASLHETFATFLVEQSGSAAGEYRSNIEWHLAEAERLRAELVGSRRP